MYRFFHLRIIELARNNLHKKGDTFSGCRFHLIPRTFFMAARFSGFTIFLASAEYRESILSWYLSTIFALTIFPRLFRSLLSALKDSARTPTAEGSHLGGNRSSYCPPVLFWPMTESSSFRTA